MQTFDDLDILMMAWLALMFAFLIVIAIIAHVVERSRYQVLPNPQRRAVCDHCRWYRVTTSRLNDHRPNGGTRRV